MAKQSKAPVPAGEPPQASPDPPAQQATRRIAAAGEVCVLPLHQLVVYPLLLTPVQFEGDKAVPTVDLAMQAERKVAFLTLGQEWDGDTLPAAGIGTVAIIQKLAKVPEQGVGMLVEGQFKARLSRLRRDGDVIRADYEELPEDEVLSQRGEALYRTVLNQCHQIVERTPYLPEEFQAALHNVDRPIRLAYIVGLLLKFSWQEKQQLLELPTVEAKLDMLAKLLGREVELLKIGGKITSQVQSGIQQSQREYYLRQQLKAIQEELGEQDERAAEMKELRGRIEAARLPEEAHKAATRELTRLEKLPPASSEYHVVRTYIDCILDLPWRAASEDDLDVAHARAILDEDHFDLTDVKDRIIEYLAVRKLTDRMKGPILCFAGPPGVGKTSLGMSIARALGRKFQRLALGGMRDEAEIRGHRRTYVGAMPGRVLECLRRAGTNNPVIMLDEIDKVGADFRGDPSSALLEVLDPEQNHTFRDHYLDLPFDLSRVLFITTANTLATIQPALRDRLEILTLSGYTEEEKLMIAKKYIVPKQRAAHGLTAKQVSIDVATLRRIIGRYTREAGVRTLERQIAALYRKAALKAVEQPRRKAKIRIRAQDLQAYLGPELHQPEMAYRKPSVGVVAGVAWTPAGGDILFIEAISMPGQKGLQLTGKLGDVMKESARAAHSYIRSRMEALDIPADYFTKHDLHVHVPAGAIPKDGPSAGISMATAIASVVTGRPVRHDVAMTGEVTLTGRVLPVGGIKEKVLAAKRAGIREVILPARNEPDVQEIDEPLRNGLTFHYVDHVDEVLEIALLPLNGKAGHTPRPRARKPRRTRSRRKG